jgi:lipoate---protein ligase
MIEKLYTISASAFIPYRNQALEKYLLEHVEDNACILYLWRNDRTVVIGRNQNAWKECDCARLEAEGGFLARRLSGGGAVFHDIGNLNFTFLCTKENYDVQRQMNVILEAVRRFGISAECTGRNDVTVDGKKISGNAYYSTVRACYHHGTLLLSSSISDLSKYLTVSQKKLSAKGVDSVRSRVTNLCEYVPGISVEAVSEKLSEAFSAVYGLPVSPYPRSAVDERELSSYESDFSSWDWKYGRTVPFTCEKSGRFAWGGVDIQLQITGGFIEDAVLWTDALDIELVRNVSCELKGVRFSGKEIADGLARVPVRTEAQKQMMSDIYIMLEEMR